MSRLAVLAFLGLLAACQTNPLAILQTPDEPPAPATSAPEPAQSAALPPARSDPDRKNEVAAKAARLAEPGHLRTLEPETLRAELGVPTFVRRDPPAEIWQWRTEACVLDLFLYPRGKSGSLQVAHLEYRGRGGEAAPAAADCLGTILSLRPAEG